MNNILWAIAGGLAALVVIVFFAWLLWLLIRAIFISGKKGGGQNGRK
jgi:hypothetical protein